MRKSIKFAFVFACGSVLLLAQPPRGRMGPGGFGIMGEGPGSRTVVTGAPYSAVQTSTMTQTLAGSNQIKQTNESKVYRDAQGRVRTEHTQTDRSGQQRSVITIFDPVAGSSYILNPASLTAMQRPVPVANSGNAAPARMPGARDGAQVQTNNLGTSVINGVSATGTQTVETIPAGAIGNAQPIQITRTVWVSTDLKVPVQIITSDPRFGNTDFELTNIVRSEPDGSLFVVPSNYTTSSVKGFGGGPAGRMRRGPAPN